MTVTILNDIQLETRGEKAFVLSAGTSFSCELSHNGDYIKFYVPDDDGNFHPIVLKIEDNSIKIKF